MLLHTRISNVISDTVEPYVGGLASDDNLAQLSSKIREILEHTFGLRLKEYSFAYLKPGIKVSVAWGDLPSDRMEFEIGPVQL